MLSKPIGREAIDRAEKVAEKLQALSVTLTAEQEAKNFKKPRSLSSPRKVSKPAKVKNYDFTDSQLEIAQRSLDAKDSV